MQMNEEKNLDPNEIAKFDALADEWWDPNGPMKPLHQLNPLRLQFITQQIPLRNKHILDVGCGGGLLSEVMQKEEASVVGIDLSDAVIQAAKQHAEQNQLNIDYQIISVEDYAAKHLEQFDIVTCMELLEHVPNPSQIINACEQATKPGGFLFFATINRNLKSFLMAIVGAEYILNLLPRGTHHYDKLIKPSELTQMAKQCGLQLHDIQGIEYRPFSGQFELSKNTDVNYLICYQKPRQAE